MLCERNRPEVGQEELCPHPAAQALQGKLDYQLPRKVGVGMGGGPEGGGGKIQAEPCLIIHLCSCSKPARQIGNQQPRKVGLGMGQREGEGG